MPQPNILFIMADQLTQTLTGAYGHPTVQTPHLSALAERGVRFDNAYTPNPLCGPARAALATGKYASSIGVYDNASLFPADEVTMSHYLTLAGYDCVVSGKLHYVGPDQLHGFSRRLTTDIYPEDFRWLQNRDPSRAHDPAFKGNHAAQYVADAIRIEWHSNLAFDEEATFHAMQYLRARGQDKRRQHAAGEDYQPFFLMASFHHPHDPFKPPQEYWDIYEGLEIDLPELPANIDETYSVLDRWLNQWHGIDRHNVNDPDSLRTVRRAYYALVTYIDAKVGQLIHALEENGLSEDTIVVFTSDHGDMLGERGMVQKRTFYDASTRVPLIIRFPDSTHAGKIVAEPVSLLDLLPTFLDIAGVTDCAPHHGHSLLPAIQNNQPPAWDVFAESHAEGVYGTCFMLRSAQYKYNYIVHRDGVDTQLFDMHADPDEWHNLSGNSAYATLEADLKSRILQQFDPAAIERDIQASIRRRRLLKTWGNKTGVSWKYTPEFETHKRTLDQYLPPDRPRSDR